MKKLMLVIIPILLAIVVFGIFLFVVSRLNVAKGALQVTSLPTKATVYLNDKKIGETPLCECDQQDTIQAGQYTIKVVPKDSSLEPYEEKISINPSVLTVVDRTFGPVGKSSGSILTLTPNNQKDAQLFVSSFPYGASVSLDSNPEGQTPLTLTITDSDHEIDLSKDGYEDKTVHVHAIKGYVLSAVVFLAASNITSSQEATSSSSTNQASATASASGGLSGQQIVVLDTPTGFLRVRATPSLAGAEIAQIKPGEKYSLISEQTDWFQIKLGDGRLGWISTQYAQKQ